MGYRKQGQMDQITFNIMMFAIIIAICLVVDSIIIGIFYGIGKLLWKVYLKREAREDAKTCRLMDVMEKANSFGLPEAIELLKGAGIYFDFSNRFGCGKRFVLPKYFWMGSIYPQAVMIKARTLITLATHAFAAGNNFGTNTSQEVSAELLLTLFGQIKKNPNLIMAIESQLVQHAVGSAKFSVMLEQLDQYKYNWR